MSAAFSLAFGSQSFYYGIGYQAIGGGEIFLFDGGMSMGTLTDKITSWAASDSKVLPAGIWVVGLVIQNDFIGSADIFPDGMIKGWVMVSN